ncbi:MAG: zinc ribbon domain-containing protein [Phascolarctobacterium sp.]|nr:zinc ribbon domain-containing protein [Phascolarctobacterium sp.]
MKLWLIDAIDLDYSQCSPEIIVANTEAEAKARYTKEHPISFYSVNAYEIDVVEGWHIGLYKSQVPRKVGTGVGMSEHIVCGNCHRPVNQGEAYCKTCGTKIDWEEL